MKISYQLRSLMFFSFFALCFCINPLSAQNRVKSDEKKTIKKEQKNDDLKSKALANEKAPELIEAEQAPANGLIRMIGEYRLEMIDGTKVVVDPKGTQLLINADDFERIYKEEQLRKQQITTPATEKP